MLKEHNRQVSVEETLHNEHLELMDAFTQLQKKMEDQSAEHEADREARRAERDAEREEHRLQIEELLRAREADRETLKQELLSMIQAGQGAAVLAQVNAKS